MAARSPSSAMVSCASIQVAWVLGKWSTGMVLQGSGGLRKHVRNKAVLSEGCQLARNHSNWSHGLPGMAWNWTKGFVNHQQSKKET